MNTTCYARGQGLLPPHERKNEKRLEVHPADDATNLFCMFFVSSTGVPHPSLKRKIQHTSKNLIFSLLLSSFKFFSMTCGTNELPLYQERPDYRNHSKRLDSLASKRLGDECPIRSTQEI